MPYLLIILVLSLNIAFSQNVSNPKNNELNLNFKKYNITWNWQNNLNYYYSNNKYGVEFKNAYNTNLVSPVKNINNWRDENKFNGFFYKYHSKFQTGIYSNSWFFSDKQTSRTNQFSNHSLGLKTVYYPISKVTLTPYAGYQSDQNKSNRDWGWDFGIHGKYSDFLLDDYKGNLTANLDYDYYPNRKNTKEGIQLDFKTRFSPFTTDSLKLYYFHSDKLYYSSTEFDSATGKNLLNNSNLEEKYVHNFFNYRLSQATNFELQTILSSSNISDDGRSIPKRDVLKFENRINIFYTLNKLLLNFGFDTFQETQDNTKIDTDSKLLQSNLRTNVFYRITQNDQVNFKFNLAKFQYDTPDSIENNDDRDELRIIAGLEYLRRFSPVLNFGIEAYINFFHQVYIFKEKSANNSWNRIFRISTFVNYNGKNFHNSLKNEILANYTVYDFDQLFDQSQSFIFRKYILQDSLTYRIMPKLNIGLNSRFEYEDKGSFFKNEFAQQLLQSSKSLFVDLFLRFKNIYLLDIDCGSAIYNRNDWRHVPKKTMIRDVNTITPYFRLRYILNQNLYFVSSASYVFSNEMNMRQSRYTTGSLSLMHNF